MCSVFFFEGGWKIFTRMAQDRKPFEIKEHAFGQGQIRSLTINTG